MTAMLTQDEIDQLVARLRTYRRTLAHYLQQRAALSSSFEPPGVSAGIREARTQIAQLKAALRAQHIAVEEHPDDVESLPVAPEPTPPPTPNSVAGAPPSPHRMPFAPSRPLVPPEPIFGRDHLLQQVGRSLRDGQSVNLVGAKALGKTSLINYLLAEDGPLRPTPICWAVLNLDAIHQVGQFYAAAATGLLLALPAEQQRQPAPAALIAEATSGSVADAELLRRVLSAYARLQPIVLPLLAIDNFEKLLRPTSAQAFHFPTFFDDLREMRQTRRLLMLVASDERIERYCTERRDGLTSSFYDGLMVYHLPELAPSDAEALLLQPGRHSLTNAEVRAARDWAGGHPAHLQIAGTALYRARDEGSGLEQALRYYRDQIPLPLPAPAQVAPQRRGVWGWLRHALAWLLSLPKHLGQLIKRIGSGLDALSAWIFGLFFVVVVLLVVFGVIPLEQARAWLQDMLGLGGT
ncbi:hypothetical protein EYB53_016540 [Candidatus Chloroploca sp. M-50]|uniref:AAA family ATPase n=1 Tax=Candidatus Chloroploca mongolica TaxID=2528176 RepID=A0ABS4DD17_9CHLR|nr:hypothetical protein [Candidatus Chloroploca mongolica]MBP1467323.1 hypothetical protein [Candidatus Chloroploca mongolica]